MPANHTYKFEVIVNHRGSLKDFEWFFSERRQSMDSEAKLISHEETPLSDNEKKPKALDRRVKKFLGKSLEMAGFEVVKAHTPYESKTKKTAWMHKTGDTYTIQTYWGPNLKFEAYDTKLTTIQTTYEVLSGGRFVKTLNTPIVFDMDKPETLDKVSSFISDVFRKD